MRRPEPEFTESIYTLSSSLAYSGIEHEIYYLKGESLVERARDCIVRTFLQTNYERLLMIDDDIQFIPEDVEKLWNMDVDVACASYPMKKEGIPSTVWVDGKMLDTTYRTGIQKVDFAPTGFLMIKRPVFDRFHGKFPERKHMDLIDGAPPIYEPQNLIPSFCYFLPRVTESIDWMKRVRLSEDYGFSQDWRDIGGEIWCNLDIKLVHWGRKGYGL